MLRCEHVNLLDLPTSILQSIAQNSITERSSLHLASTCRQLRDAVLSVASTTKVSLNSQSVFSHKTLGLLRSCQSVHFNLFREASEDTQISEKLRWGFQTMLLGYTLHYGAPLRSLTVLHLKGLHQDCLIPQAVVGVCPSLHTFILEDCMLKSPPKPDCQLLPCASVRRLKIIKRLRIRHVADEQFVQQLRVFSKLESLTVQEDDGQHFSNPKRDEVGELALWVGDACDDTLAAFNYEFVSTKGRVRLRDLPEQIDIPSSHSLKRVIIGVDVGELTFPQLSRRQDLEYVEVGGFDTDYTHSEPVLPKPWPVFRVHTLALWDLDIVPSGHITINTFVLPTYEDYPAGMWKELAYDPIHLMSRFIAQGGVHISAQDEDVGIKLAMPMDLGVFPDTIHPELLQLLSSVMPLFKTYQGPMILYGNMSKSQKLRMTVDMLSTIVAHAPGLSRQLALAECCLEARDLTRITSALPAQITKIVLHDCSVCLPGPGDHGQAGALVEGTLTEQHVIQMCAAATRPLTICVLQHSMQEGWVHRVRLQLVHLEAGQNVTVTDTDPLACKYASRQCRSQV